MRRIGVCGVVYGLTAGLLASTASGFAGVAMAQEQGRQFSFNITAKPVTQAVNDIGRITGLSVVFRENRAMPATGKPVRGAMTAQGALDTLLSGTGLTYRFSNATTVQIYDPATGAANGDAANADGSTVLKPIVVQGDTKGANSFVATNATGATKGDVPLIEVPQSVTVIGRKQMEAQNAQSVTEVLRYVPGVTIETYGPDPKGYDWILMRGFNAQSTSSYLDGLRQVSSSYSFFRTDPYQLDSVEVLRGPPPRFTARAMPAASSTRPRRSRPRRTSARSSWNSAATSASRPPSTSAARPTRTRACSTVSSASPVMPIPSSAIRTVPTSRTTA